MPGQSLLKSRSRRRIPNTTNKDLLAHAGTVSAEIAKQKADSEYDKYQKRIQYDLSPVEIHFIESFEKEVKKLKK